VTQVAITFDVEPLTRELADTRLRQMPYAVMMTLNRTAEEAQEAIRQRIFQRGFTVRSAVSARFLANSIKFSRGDRATKTSAVARLTIEPPGKGGGRSGLLGFLEEGGVRFSQFAIGSGATFGPGSVAIPQRDGPMQQMPRNLYPSQTGLQERRSIEGGLTAGSLKGGRRTFAIRTKAGEGLILQRTGSKQKRAKHNRIVGGNRMGLWHGDRENTRVLFVIKPRVRVEGRHFFFPTFERTVLARLEVNLLAFMGHALRTAR
jgi:hypothetical protein